MNTMNTLPLQVTGASTLAVVALTLWLAGGSGVGRDLRARLRALVLGLDRLTTGIAAILACLALAIGVVAGLWQVFSRFATETPAVWSEALVRTSLIWMAYLGLALALRGGALVSIDVAQRLTAGAVRRAVEAAALACSLSLMGIMFWFGWTMAQRVQFQEMAGLEVSMSWGYAAIPIGAVFAMIGAVAHFLDRRGTELEFAA